MTTLGGGKVMLIGGINMKRGNDVYSNHVYEGELTKCKEDVKWKELDSLINSRYGHITFKMKEYVLVSGGSKGFGKHLNCERYDLQKQKWSKNVHNLPVGLSNASVIVNTKETFAVITGGETEDYKTTNKIIIYTEQNGFVEYGRCTLNHSRKKHVSLFIR